MQLLKILMQPRNKLNRRHVANMVAKTRVVRRAGIFHQNVSGLHTKSFHNMQRNDFFLSWPTFVVFTTGTSVNEAIVIFLQLILHLFAHTVKFFCSLLTLFLRKQTVVRKLARDGVASKRLITYAILGLF